MTRACREGTGVQRADSQLQAEACEIILRSHAANSDRKEGDVPDPTRALGRTLAGRLLLLICNSSGRELALLPIAQLSLPHF